MTVTNMAAVKNNATAIISINTKNFLLELSLSPTQSENNKHNWYLKSYYIFSLLRLIQHYSVPINLYKCYKSKSVYYNYQAY